MNEENSPEDRWRKMSESGSFTHVRTKQLVHTTYLWR